MDDYETSRLVQGWIDESILTLMPTLVSSSLDLKVMIELTRRADKLVTDKDGTSYIGYNPGWRVYTPPAPSKS